jgi:putative Holliday junction resolvase
MHKDIFLGFDFGYKRIGVAVGQRLTRTATPLSTLQAIQGVPNWKIISQLIDKWRPEGLVVGLPTCVDDKALYTTAASRRFATELNKRFGLPVHLIDERFSTVEARALLFAEGGFRKIKKSEVDCIAACIILEQWLGTLSSSSGNQ